MGAEAPRGEQAVRTSLVDAAIELFASRGPSRVSVREVAAAARVNHGLVHHYFGSKDGLLHAVLDELARRSAAELGDRRRGSARYLAQGAAAQHGRILAHVVLDGRDPSALQSEFPAVRALVDTLRADGLDDQAARARAAQVTALVLGWQLFEPFLTAAAGLAVSDDDRALLLDEGVTRLVGRAGQRRSNASLGLSGSSVSGWESSDTVGPT